MIYLMVEFIKTQRLSLKSSIQIPRRVLKRDLWTEKYFILIWHIFTYHIFGLLIMVYVNKIQGIPMQSISSRLKITSLPGGWWWPFFTSLTLLIREGEISKIWRPLPETPNIYFRKGQFLSACHLQNTNLHSNRKKRLLFYLLGRENE